MTRSVLRIVEQQGQLAACVENADPPLPNDYDEAVPFGFPGHALPPLDDGTQYGSKLVQGLAEQKAVAKVLERAFGANGAEPHALALLVRAGDGRQIRWETLRDDNGRFVALDGRCPIGRVTRRLSSTHTAAQVFQPPLRLLAFVSGTQLDMQAEWDALAAAIDQAHADGLPVAAIVHIGESTLRDAAAAGCTAGHHPAIEVLAMPDSAAKLEQQIQRVRPHLLHFFCHGKGGIGSSFVQLATAQDHALGRTGSIELDAEQLASIAALREAWLVVLNCCEGAQADAEIESMAETIVKTSGARAIGMLEPVASGEASVFSGTLYPEVFRVLEGVLRMAPGSPPQIVDFTPALSVPRRALQTINPPLHPGARWTLPVLYQELQLLEVVRAAMPPTMLAAPPGSLAPLRARAQTVADFLASMPPDTPAAARQDALALLDLPPVVPPELRPDAFGRFSSAGGGGG